MELTGLSRKILDAMDDDDARDCATIEGSDVVLLLPRTSSHAPVTKSACFAGTIMNKRDQDAFIESLFLDADHCIEIIVFDQQDSLLFFDMTNPRRRLLNLQDLDENIISCFKRYMKSGNRIFLDPIFDDHVFKKSCWSAFQESMVFLDSFKESDHESRVRIVLQSLVIAMLRQMDILKDIETDLGTIVQGMIGNKVNLVDLSPAIIVDPANLPSIDLVQMLAPWQSIPGFPEQLDEMMLCFLMERSLPENYRKKSGSYYTPRTWAWFACHRSLQAWIEKNHPNTDDNGLERLITLRILDPAMGSGDFLDAMVNVLVDAMIGKGEPSLVGVPFDWNVARLRAKIDHVLKDMVHGIDVNPIAVDTTRTRFFLNVLKHASFAKDVASLLQSFSINLIQDDYLTMPVSGPGYDIIIGNPPYLMEVRSNQATFRRYSNHPETSPRYEPKMDVFYFFMFKDIDILNEMGIMSIFVQEYWLDRYHARHLREFVFSSTVPLHVILFKRYKVFQDAPGHHSMLYLACKQDPASIDASGHVVVVQDEKVLNDDLLKEIIDQAGAHIHDMVIDAATFYDAQKDKVYVEGNDERQFFEQLHAMPHFFINEDEIQVGINIPQPFIRRSRLIEGVFVIPIDQLERMNLTKDEQELLKPFHKATDIDAFFFATREELFIIYTTNDAKMRVENRPDLYPSIRAHLDSFANYITSDHKPYGLHRPRQPEWFEARLKIIGIRKTKAPKFAIVPQDYYMDQSAVIIWLDAPEQYSPYFICAYLNSSIALKMLGGMKSQGGQLQIDKSVLVKLPIPSFSSDVVKLVSCLSSWLHVLGVMSTTEFNAEIEPGLTQSIESLLDTIFKEVIDNGENTSFMLEKLVKAFHDMAMIHVENYLVTSNLNTSMPFLKTTRIDTHELWKSVKESLHGLSIIITDLLPTRSDT